MAKLSTILNGSYNFSENVGLSIDHSGSNVATGVDGIDFSNNLSVTDNGNGTVTVDSSGGGGGGLNPIVAALIFG